MCCDSPLCTACISLLWGKYRRTGCRRVAVIPVLRLKWAEELFVIVAASHVTLEQTELTIFRAVSFSQLPGRGGQKMGGLSRNRASPCRLEITLQLLPELHTAPNPLLRLRATAKKLKWLKWFKKGFRIRMPKPLLQSFVILFKRTKIHTLCTSVANLFYGLRRFIFHNRESQKH